MLFIMPAISIIEVVKLCFCNKQKKVSTGPRVESFQKVGGMVAIMLGWHIKTT